MISRPQPPRQRLIAQIAIARDNKLYGSFYLRVTDEVLEGQIPASILVDYDSAINGGNPGIESWTHDEHVIEDFALLESLDLPFLRSLPAVRTEHQPWCRAALTQPAIRRAARLPFAR